MSRESDDLPAGWRRIALAEVADHTLGKMLDHQKHTRGKRLPYLRNINVQWQRIDTHDVLEMCFEDDELERFGLRTGDFLVCEGGEPGRGAIWDGRVQQMQYQKALHRVRPSAELLSEYLQYHLKHDATSGALDKYFTGTTIKHFTGRNLARYELRLAPIQEQRRIVAKIEALTQKSRRAKEALEAIPPLLERFRQSVLASAFRGDLTKDWRAKHPDVEPAEALLKRIRQERRNRWEEAELTKLKAKGKPPKDDRWKQRYEEPAPVDAEGLPELPDGWCWARVEDLTSHIVDCLHRTPTYVDDGIPAIRTADVVPGRLLLDHARRVTRRTYTEQVSRLIPQAGDVLYTREGERFGLAALVPAGVELCMAQRMMQFRTVEGISPAFFMWALNSSIGYEQAVNDVGGSTSPHVNIGSIRRFHLPMAPQKEQAAIASSVGAAWIRADAIQRSVAAPVSLLDQLDASILAKAFRGELTSDASND